MPVVGYNGHSTGAFGRSLPGRPELRPGRESDTLEATETHDEYGRRREHTGTALLTRMPLITHMPLLSHTPLRT